LVFQKNKEKITEEKEINQGCYNRKKLNIVRFKKAE
jgi:hypothetical protein